MPKALDLTGQRHGRLTVLKKAVRPKTSKNAIWECQCDCGLLAYVAASNIGKTVFSCGCLQQESATATLRRNRLARTDLHGMSKTPEWNIWSGMKQRCNNPKDHKYPRYGGRGIKVCKRWEDSFQNFIADMGHRPSKRYSIDRIDNDGPYSPENCRWATMPTQGRNASTTVWIEIDGRKLCIEDWCRTLGVPRWKVYEMIRPTGRNRKGPPKFTSIEAAIKHLHGATAHH